MTSYACQKVRAKFAMAAQLLRLQLKFIHNNLNSKILSPRLPEIDPYVTTKMWLNPWARRSLFWDRQERVLVVTKRMDIWIWTGAKFGTNMLSCRDCWMTHRLWSTNTLNYYLVYPCSTLWGHPCLNFDRGWSNRRHQRKYKEIPSTIETIMK